MQIIYYCGGPTQWLTSVGSLAAKGYSSRTETFKFHILSLGSFVPSNPSSEDIILNLDTQQNEGCFFQDFYINTSSSPSQLIQQAKAAASALPEQPGTAQWRAPQQHAQQQHHNKHVTGATRRNSEGPWVEKPQDGGGNGGLRGCTLLSQGSECEVFRMGDYKFCTSRAEHRGALLIHKVAPVGSRAQPKLGFKECAGTQCVMHLWASQRTASDPDQEQAPRKLNCIYKTHHATREWHWSKVEERVDPCSNLRGVHLNKKCLVIKMDEWELEPLGSLPDHLESDAVPEWSQWMEQGLEGDEQDVTDEPRDPLTSAGPSTISHQTQQNPVDQVRIQDSA
eukprot:scaffold147052_cov18-Tisochrysis_lutea.AAC.2